MTTAQLPVVNYEVLEGFLGSRPYSDNYTNVPTAAIGNELKAQFTEIFSALGEEVPESFLVVKAENGMFDRLYTPALYKATKEQVLASAYGKANEESLPEELAAVRFTRELIVPLAAFEAIEGGSIEPGEKILQILMPESEAYPEGFIFEVGLRLEDYENPPQSVMVKRYLKKGELHTILSEIKLGGNTKKLYELGENTTHTVVGYTSREGDYGLQFSVELEDGSYVYCNRALEATLRNTPTITKELPAMLQIGEISETKAGKKRVKCSLQLKQEAYSKDSFDGFSLDW